MYGGTWPEKYSPTFPFCGSTEGPWDDALREARRGVLLTKLEVDRSNTDAMLPTWTWSREVSQPSSEIERSEFARWRSEEHFSSINTRWPREEKKRKQHRLFGSEPNQVSVWYICALVLAGDWSHWRPVDFWLSLPWYILLLPGYVPP